MSVHVTPVPIEDAEDDPIMAELRRIRREIAAEYGDDSRRRCEDMWRQQPFVGNDVVRRNKDTGEFEVIFKGSGKANFDALKEMTSRNP